jgi:hypothetical protein
MLVPRGAAARIEIHSPGVELADDSARTIPASHSRDVGAVADGVPVVFTVRGVRAQGAGR